LIIASSWTVSGCRDEHKDEAGRDERSKPARPDSETKQPRQRAAPEDGDGFPKLPQVEPPALFARQLRAIAKKAASESRRERVVGLRELREIVRDNPKNVELAKYLVSLPSIRLINEGLRIWGRMKIHPEFLRFTTALMGHDSDRVRHSVLSLYNMGVPITTWTEALPYVRKLLDDPSCNVRRQALHALLANRRRLQRSFRKEVYRAFGDVCPAVKAVAMQHMPELVGKKPPEALVAKLKKKLSKSPYYLIRCAALRALAGMKHPELEKLAAPYLAEPVRDGLIVAYEKKGGWSHSIAGSLPACAASALGDYHGKRPKGDVSAKVGEWIREMAKKGLVERVGPKLCLKGKRDCSSGEVCLEMRCRPPSRAVDAYWKHERLARCEKRSPRRKWWNVTTKAAAASGFGLDPAGIREVEAYLKKTKPALYSKKLSEIRKKKCPGR
jgi:hypothetical protein